MACGSNRNACTYVVGLYPVCLETEEGLKPFCGTDTCPIVKRMMGDNAIAATYAQAATNRKPTLV